MGVLDLGFDRGRAVRSSIVIRRGVFPRDMCSVSLNLIALVTPWLIGDVRRRAAKESRGVAFAAAIGAAISLEFCIVSRAQIYFFYGKRDKQLTASVGVNSYSKYSVAADCIAIV
jgi:hypothetical protein